MPEISLKNALSKRRSGRSYNNDAVTLTSLLNLLHAAQGITDNKGNLTTPSAHSLQTLSLLVTAGRISNLEEGVYRATKNASALTKLSNQDKRRDLQDAAIGDQPWIANCAGIITICADTLKANQAFAEHSSTGTRGERYIYIEAGCVAQNIQLQATSEQLASVAVAGFKDEETARALDLTPPITPVLHICFGQPKT